MRHVNGVTHKLGEEPVELIFEETAEPKTALIRHHKPTRWVTYYEGKLRRVYSDQRKHGQLFFWVETSKCYVRFEGDDEYATSND